MHALVELGYCAEFAKVAPREGISMRNTSLFLLRNGMGFLSFKREQKQRQKKRKRVDEFMNFISMERDSAVNKASDPDLSSFAQHCFDRLPRKVTATATFHPGGQQFNVEYAHWRHNIWNFLANLCMLEKVAGKMSGPMNETKPYK